MTSRPKLAEATKEINQQTGVILEETARVKRNIDNVLQSLRKQEAQFQRAENEQRDKKRQEEAQQLSRQHTKAWTMPDEPEKPAVKEEAPKAKEEKKAAPAKQEVKQEAPKAATVQEKPVQETKAEAPAKQEAPKAAPAANQQRSQNAANNQQRPQQGQQNARPANQAPAANNQQRPQNAANGQPGARPVNERGPYGRPANPQGQQGQQNARPVNQQGPYGRPANGQPFARPVNQQGPYGRPANPQGQQGQQNARPVNQQGPFGRPANGQPFNNNRPALQGQNGGFGRPAGGAAAQGNRPMGGNRPAGGTGRPQGGGFGRPKAPELAPVVEKERVSNYDPNKKQYLRQHDPEHVSKNRKQLQKESFNGYDDETVRGGKRARAKKPSVQQMMAPIKIEKAYMTADTITVKDLTERIGKPAGEILKKLLMLGIMANINSELDFDTASLVCGEFEVTLEKKMDKTAEDVLSDINVEDKEEDLQPRPPVITIMGHVDHGKTSLLDYIRKAHVTSTEAGGITQHIGAYTVELDGRKITFLDTPGHEAFTAMRMRGAQATDIAVLVVAADDGVMPQTIEAINHAKAANVPIVVAINKMDKPTANPDRIKEELTKYELIAEEWGGETIMAPVSAMTGDGVDELLELILLQADMLTLRANPNRMASGVIIEAKLDKARGPLATVLLQNGTLNIGDNIVAGTASGRVRAMLNDRGERVKTAGPSMPVEISGFTEVPSAGDEMFAVEDDKLSRMVAEERREKLKASRTATTKVSLDNLFANINEGKVQELNIIVKADVQGSVEAVKQALEKLSNSEVKVRILHSAVGAITQDDVNLAAAFGAIIIGFNIRPDATARNAADKEEVDIRLYRIIYQAIEDIEKAMKGMLDPVLKETILGHAQVRNVFKITGAGMVAGSYVTDGKMQRNASVRLLRDNVVVFEGKLSSLRRFKDDVREVNQGYECGISLENFSDIKENDVVECFIMEEVES